MNTHESKYVDQEVGRRGEELFEQSIAQQVAEHEPVDHLVIDVDSGDFEVDEDLIVAVERLRDRRPDARLWLRRVGSRTLMRIGGAQAG